MVTYLSTTWELVVKIDGQHPYKNLTCKMIIFCHCHWSVQLPCVIFSVSNGLNERYGLIMALMAGLLLCEYLLLGFLMQGQINVDLNLK